MSTQDHAMMRGCVAPVAVGHAAVGHGPHAANLVDDVHRQLAAGACAQMWAREVSTSVSADQSGAHLYTACAVCVQRCCMVTGCDRLIQWHI